MAGAAARVPGDASARLPVSARLAILLVFTGVCSNEVLVPKRVSVVLGQNASLGCHVEVGTNLSLTQSSWERLLPTGMITVAVFNPQFGISVAKEYRSRVRFLNPSVEDASILLEGVGFADIGPYTCKVVTFPLGNTQASTTLDVMVEPKVYVSAGSVLVDGDQDVVVATCTAERALPPAWVSWETELSGRLKEFTQEEPNGTGTTTQVGYVWSPHRDARGHALICVVRHPALVTELRIPYVLDVQFAPDVLVEGQDEVWYVGQENAKLDCRADANPVPHAFFWTRLDVQMPEGVVIANGSLRFTRPLRKNNSGTYRCDVQNAVGLRSQEVDIWIRERPPTTAVPTTREHVTIRSSSTSPAMRQAHFTSPTLASPPAGIVGGAVGGVLSLALLLGCGTLCYVRRRRTFRGDYYTKHYTGPCDMQKESQPDQIQSHQLLHVFANDSGHGSQDLKLKPDGDVIYPNYPKDEGGWGDSLQRPCTYYPDDEDERHHKVNPSRPHSPTLNNGAPYIQDDCYDNCTDCDYVSHTDGSVISRREWYV
ncbi:nectin-3-like protein [Electrophorus electricus]|uniref:nectin-3-like protein n=1 Tax=Electrophorus electricus TaxID=8005 RepID=UPI0015D0AC48|nr:nectin-3-like protein [Electrophorus electricus]